MYFWKKYFINQSKQSLLVKVTFKSNPVALALFTMLASWNNAFWKYIAKTPDVCKSHRATVRRGGGAKLQRAESCNSRRREFFVSRYMADVPNHAPKKLG